MLRCILKSKIHRAVITQTDLYYVGSITIDKNMMDAVGLLEYEKVDIFDIQNGNRFETYVIEGERGSGIIGINGAAARLVHLNDEVIIVSYALLNEDEISEHQPKIIVVKENNKDFDIEN
ncbi:MAG: aspartate 1-decarboxylase [Candidatus Cloacimonetes bacterium]|nr:aspartate 1-decarboxylase [Candidatus Cloacimonadota bacterium]